MEYFLVGFFTLLDFVLLGNFPTWDFFLMGFCPLGFCPLGFCPLGFCPHVIFSSGIFSSWDFILHGILFLSSWDFFLEPCTYILCPDTLVPQDELWPDTSLSLVNNNIIIIVSTRLIGENTSMLNCCWPSEVKCDYLTTVMQSQAVFLLEYFVIL